MDITCPRCGEPMDHDELHHSSLGYPSATKTFYDVTKGCGVVLTGKPCQLRVNKQTYRAQVLREVLGDDLDGIAAMEVECWDGLCESLEPLIIRGPGKFEGCPRYMPYMWQLVCQGDYLECDTHSLHGDRGCAVVVLEPDDLVRYPELTGRSEVHLIENDDGFVVEL